MTIILDENFIGPDEINLHPCLTSSRFLNKIDEAVNIVQVCQDSNNTSLIIIDFSLIGVYLFSPTLKILSVDGDTSYTDNNVVGQLAVGHYKNSAIPINTHCGTIHGQLVYDIGSLITNYINAQVIDIELIMVGTVPTAYGVSYPNQTVSSTFSWFKGKLPTPIGLTYSNNTLGLSFDYSSEATCNCQMQCITPTGVSHSITFCPNDKQTIFLYKDSSSVDPYNILIQLEDALGNASSIELQSLYNVKPLPPIVVYKTIPKRIEIYLNKNSINQVEINSSAYYRILRYHNNSSNYVIWKDWSNLDWNHFIDYDIVNGDTYGYAVVYKGQFDDISSQSDWTIVTP